VHIDTLTCEQLMVYLLVTSAQFQCFWIWSPLCPKLGIAIPESKGMRKA